MKLTSVMVDLGGGTASLGLFGDITEDNIRPPHVQVTVNIDVAGDAAHIRRRAVHDALAAIGVAAETLRDELE